MIVRRLTLLPVTILLLVACSSTNPANRQTQTPATTTAPQALQAPAGTPPGTWEMVIEGMIYDEGTNEPIAGATVSYVVVHSYFPEIQEGRPNTTRSDAQGMFSLPMIVHDTDNIRIRVEAEGYVSYEERLDLMGDRRLNIGLTPYEELRPTEDG